MRRCEKLLRIGSQVFFKYQGFLLEVETTLLQMRFKILVTDLLAAIDWADGFNHTVRAARTFHRREIILLLGLHVADVDLIPSVSYEFGFARFAYVGVVLVWLLIKV